ncbi:carbohydrate sulfotransferase 11 [Anabrus simplex]|uniref:carbohydrate sulfotransferase 11 n=1 Tax=Anabrus simplex TaxID=316456 RepID=UPI0035A34C8E
MRGICRWLWLLLRTINRYRSVLQVFILLVVGTGYCLLLGSSAVTAQHDAALTTSINHNYSKVKHKLLQQEATLKVTPGQNVVEDEGVDLEDLETELQARRQRVWDVCLEHNLHNKGQANAWEFFVDAKHSLVWCNIFKAASSTWMYNFNLLAGYREYYLRRTRKTPLNLARAHFPRPTIQQLQAALPESLSFLIVREPFERLLSAYRNKIEGLRHRFYRKLGREMVLKYRTKTEEYAALHPERNITIPAMGPTFSEFVSYVIDTGLSTTHPKFDEHWAPYYSFCTPCHVNFTVIAKLETLTRDEEYIIHRAGLEEILMPSKSKDRPKQVINKARGGKATSDLVQKYYNQLTDEQLNKLYQIYGIDFEMFGYNASKYFKMVQKEE